MNELGERIQEYALKLTAIASVVGTSGEIRLAEAVYDELKQMSYYEQKPEHLELIDIPGDHLGRKYVLAFVTGEKVTGLRNRPAVLCLGHIDTVGISDYGELQGLATRPAELKKKLQSIQFSAETLAEINSPDWILGRGILDMKTGVAAHLAMADYFSKRVADLTGDLVFLFVPDEEGDSAGMLAAVNKLAELTTTHHYDFLAALNTDYTTTRYPNDTNRYVYVGTVGKLLPCFYLYGEETHVGEAFNGLDANLLAAEVLHEMDYNTALCDVVDGEVTLPPVSLYQRDLRKEYSVQTANAVTLYFNYFTHLSEPRDVLEQCRQIALVSFEKVIARLNEQYEKYCVLAHTPCSPLPWKKQVMTYEELYQAVKGEIGEEIDRRIQKLSEALLEQGVDDREFSLKIVEEVHRHYSNQDSKIIVYFAPPYYAHNYIKEEGQKERALFAALRSAIAKARETYQYDVIIKKFFPYISDLSFCSMSKEPGKVRPLTENMPAWQKKYQLPVRAIQTIAMPVVNIGPFGKDAHKLSERLSIPYSLDAMPLILQETIGNLLLTR